MSLNMKEFQRLHTVQLFTCVDCGLDFRSFLISPQACLGIPTGEPVDPIEIIHLPLPVNHKDFTLDLDTIQRQLRDKATIGKKLPRSLED